METCAWKLGCFPVAKEDEQMFACRNSVQQDQVSTICIFTFINGNCKNAAFCVVIFQKFSVILW